MILILKQNVKFLDSIYLPQDAVKRCAAVVDMNLQVS